MGDRRSQRIREQFKRQANGRAAGDGSGYGWDDRMRRVYQPASNAPATPNCHTQLARMLEARRGRRG